MHQHTLQGKKELKEIVSTSFNLKDFNLRGTANKAAGRDGSPQDFTVPEELQNVEHGIQRPLCELIRAYR